MSDSTTNLNRAENPDLFTVISGWVALVLGILGIHRWVSADYDWWTKSALILAAGLAILWIWGYWSTIVVKGRAWVRGGGLNTLLIAVGLIVCLVVVNTIVRRRLPMKLDLTKNQRFTLAPRTREILKHLQHPLKATVFLPSSASRSAARARDLFSQYEDAGSNFSWKKVDPLKEPQVYLAMGRPKLNETDFSGAVLEYEGKKQEVTDFTEKDITSAVLKLSRDTERKILFLKGHGEPDPNAAGAGAGSIQTVVQDLKASQWPIDTVDLYAKTATAPDPAQVALLVIAGPKRELAPTEQTRINDYLDKGGHVLLLLDPQGPTMASWLKTWGIAVSNDLVLGDPQQGGLMLVAADANAHAAVKNAQRVVFEPTRKLSRASPAPQGVTVTELLSSGPGSQVVPSNGRSVDLKKAQPGPASIAMLAEKSASTGNADQKAQLIVFGGASWFTDQWAAQPMLFDGPLATGVVNYLGQEPALVSIPPKDENTEQAFVTPSQGKLLLLIHFLDFPLLALVLAVMVYLKRR